MTARRKSGGRKLLAATIGLASVSMTGCWVTSGNLVAPPPEDAGTDSGTDSGTDAGNERDAGEEQDAGERDASDGSDTP